MERLGPRQRSTELDNTWVASVESPTVAPWLPVRVVIPRFELTAGVGGGEALRWTSGETRLGEAVDDALWEFIELEHASDDTIVTFARQYGLLSTVPAADPPGTSEAVAGWRVQPSTEPLTVWRMLAAGIHALLTIATRLSEGEQVDAIPDIEVWTSAWGAVSTIAWLTNWERRGDRPTLQDLYGERLAIDLEGTSGLNTIPVDQFRWLLTEILGHSGVRLVPPTVGMTNGAKRQPRARYAVPATGFGRLEQPSPRNDRAVTSEQTTRPPLYWRVGSLLPVLAVQLARAVEPEEHYPCTRCGLLARVVGRRPGGNREWFGDHTYCRRVHRAEVVRQAAARRYAKLKITRILEQDEAMRK